MIYPAIRGIYVGFKDTDTLKIIYYLDRAPDDSDYDNIASVSGEILGDFDINKVEEVCEYTLEPLNKIVNGGFWVYVRQEP